MLYGHGKVWYGVECDVASCVVVSGVVYMWLCAGVVSCGTVQSCVVCCGCVVCRILM